MNLAELSDSAILAELGDRLRRERLNQNRTQTDLAASASVALNVVKRLESGGGCTLPGLVRILRALGKLDQLDSFLPEPGVSPIELARLEGRKRKQASGNRGRRRHSGDTDGR